MTEQTFDQALSHLVELGLVEIAGVNSEGEMTFAITPKGEEAAVTSMTDLLMEEIDSERH